MDAPIYTKKLTLLAGEKDKIYNNIETKLSLIQRKKLSLVKGNI